jgi:flagellar biosynthesis regulator FlaF
MSEGQSQCSVASSAQHRQEAEIAATEEREQAATRLAMAELAAARAEVEAAAAGLEALHASSTGSSVFADDDRDNELKLAREAA